MTSEQYSIGLSDVHEFIYFGGPTAPFADPDCDRVTIYDEMFWGTNPTTSAYHFYRLQMAGQSASASGLLNGEIALWQSAYGQPPSQTDIDGDGMPDDQEFLLGRSPGKMDHPAVGLVVFTPLEK